jgi:hypothetical protein
LLVAGFWFVIGELREDEKSETKTRNQKPETTNQKPETTNQKPIPWKLESAS